MREHDYEPVPGLPEEMPEGETILWQGAPNMRSLIVHGMHVRAIAIYFGLLALWQVSVTLHDGGTYTEALAIAVWLVAIAAVPIAILILYASWVVKTTLYTITDRRVVMRIGVSVSTVINLPFAAIQAATVRRRRTGSGNIALSVKGRGRPFYLMLWPHVRPWRVLDTQPALRCIEDVDAVAGILAEALVRDAATSEATQSNVVRDRRRTAPESEPRRERARTLASAAG